MGGEKDAGGGGDGVLGGHTHDGQFCRRNMAVRTAWENAAGLKTVGRMTSVVTSGVGVDGPDMRIGPAAAITVVAITFAPYKNKGHITINLPPGGLA